MDDPYSLPPLFPPSIGAPPPTSSAAASQSYLDAFQPAFVGPTPASAPTSTILASDSKPPKPTTSSLFHVPELYDSRLMGQLPSTDPLSTLLNKHLPAHLRPPRDLSGSWTHGDPFTPSAPFSASSGLDSVDEGAVEEAVRTNSWRRIATLARFKIENAEMKGGGGVSEVLQWWTIRLHALARLRLYSLMHTELVGLWGVLENVEVPAPAPAKGQSLHFKLGASTTASPQRMRTRRPASSSNGNNDVKSKLLSSPLVPFSLRVMKAREGKYRGELTDAIDAHVELIAYCKMWIRKWRAVIKKKAGRREDGEEQRKEAERQEAIWVDRATRLSLVTASLLAEAKDYASATSLLSRLVSSTLRASSTSPRATHVELLSHLARLYIQAGSLSTVTSLFASAGEVCDRLEIGAEKQSVSRLVLENEALLATFRGEHREAEKKWRECGKDEADGKVDEANEGTLWNDLAVSVFYQGRLQEPVDTLENLLTTSPSSVSSVEPLLFNLCTLHELRSGDAVRDKRRILALVGQWAGDGAGTSCLKLS